MPGRNICQQRTAASLPVNRRFAAREPPLRCWQTAASSLEQRVGCTKNDWPITGTKQ